MNGGQRGRNVLAALMLGLSLGSSTLAGRMMLDPGVIDHPVTSEDFTTDMQVEPGAWAHLDMNLGQYRIEVVSGQVSVVFPNDRLTLSAGATRLIAAGTAFGLLNTGAVSAHLRISISVLDLTLASQQRRR